MLCYILSGEDEWDPDEDYERGQREAAEDEHAHAEVHAHTAAEAETDTHAADMEAGETAWIQPASQLSRSH